MLVTVAVKFSVLAPTQLIVTVPDLPLRTILFTQWVLCFSGGQQQSSHSCSTAILPAEMTTIVGRFHEL